MSIHTITSFAQFDAKYPQQSNYVGINACILRCKYAYTTGFVAVVAVVLNFFFYQGVIAYRLS